MQKIIHYQLCILPLNHLLLNLKTHFFLKLYNQLCFSVVGVPNAKYVGTHVAVTPKASLSTALNSNLHVYSSLTSSIAVLFNVTVNVPFKLSFALTTVALFANSFF